MHPQKVTVWCGFWSSEFIRLYFFEDESENAMNIAVYKKRYRQILTEYFIPELEQVDMDTRILFQQDSVTYHTTKEIIGLLHTTFQNCIISRNGTHNWPPRSSISFEFFPLVLHQVKPLC